MQKPSNLAENEITIINLLRNNSRVSLTQMSNITRIPITTIYDTISRLRKRKIINKYFSVLDYEKIGYSIRVNLIIRAKDRYGLFGYLTKSANINNLYRITNGILAECIFKNFEDYELFKEQLDALKASIVEENVIIEEISSQKSMAGSNGPL